MRLLVVVFVEVAVDEGCEDSACAEHGGEAKEHAHPEAEGHVNCPQSVPLSVPCQPGPSSGSPQPVQYQTRGSSSLSAIGVLFRMPVDAAHKLAV